VFTSRP